MHVQCIMLSREDLDVIVIGLVGWTAVCIVFLGDILGMFPPSTAAVL